MTLASAQRNGVAVDESAAKSQLKVTDVYLETWRDRMLQGVTIPGGPDTVSYILLGMAAGNYPPSEATDAVARYLKLRQAADGRWNIAAHRPPIESSDIEVTSVSMRALQAYAPTTRRAQHARLSNIGLLGSGGESLGELQVLESAVRRKCGHVRHRTIVVVEPQTLLLE